MSIEPSPDDAGPLAPSTTPQDTGSTGTFKHGSEVWWFLAAQFAVLIALLVALLI